MLRITRYGALIGRERIILPGSYLFEIPEIDKVLKSIAPAIRVGIVHVTSPATTLTLYAEKKRREYRDEAQLFGRYSTQSEIGLDSHLRFSPRIARSSSSDIAAAWAEEMDTGGLWDCMLKNQSLRRSNLSSIEKRIGTVPQRLDGRAFILRFALPLLPFIPKVQDVARIAFLISRVYLESYLDEYKAFIIADTDLGQLDCGLSTYSRTGELQKVSFRRFARLFLALGIASYFERLGWNQLLELRTKPIIDWFVSYVLTNPTEIESAVQTYAKRTKAAKLVHHSPKNGTDAICKIETQLYKVHDIITAGTFDDAFPRSASGGFSVVQIQLSFDETRTKAMNSSNNAVFLVHGRDAKVVASIKTLLRAANLNPLDWEEVVSWTGKASPGTLEVIKLGLERAQAILVLLTPDEQVHLRKELCGADQNLEHGYQPRPNVLIEIGMAVAMNPDQTLLLSLGSVRPVSDIAGLNFLQFDGKPASRNALVERLKTAGCTAARPSKEFFDMDLALPDANLSRSN